MSTESIAPAETINDNETISKIWENANPAVIKPDEVNQGASIVVNLGQLSTDNELRAK